MTDAIKQKTETPREYLDRAAEQRRGRRAIVIRDLVIAHVAGGTTMEEKALVQRCARLADALIEEGWQP